MTTPTVRTHLTIRGLVQGVYFRASTAETARRLGIAGWVRNTAEGVEAVLEGPRTAVDQAIAWCRTGPPSAVVESVESAWEKPEGLHGFSIRH
ncbi:MAG: acylphosphatase [Coriobacteriia bacterium]|nr:acylphosphatase [Coriobacteriia bacterium]